MSQEDKQAGAAPAPGPGPGPTPAPAPAPTPAQTQNQTQASSGDSEPLIELGNALNAVTQDIYAQVLHKFGTSMVDKFLKDASDQQKRSFVERLTQSQTEKLRERLGLLMNRIMIDHDFVKHYNELKLIEGLRQDIEIANNHLQSVENERTILQRDIDQAIDKFEGLSEEIMGSFT